MGDLSDAELDELEQLLARTPEPYRPLDVVMLDGYLCGVLVQPRRIDAGVWLPPVFDLDGAAFPASADPAWRARCEALVLRRHDALRAALAEDGWFDPLVLRMEAPPQEWPEELRGLSPVTIALMPWVVGFRYAMLTFTDLLELGDVAVLAALARVFRHLPGETDEERAVLATIEREHPLATLDDATDDLVDAVAELSELTHELRWRVETVRREAPKVGRNDPCPCGSGRKFKQCHGAA